MALDPAANDPFQTMDPGDVTLRSLKGRVRNRRGEYQSIDFADGSSAGG